MKYSRSMSRCIRILCVLDCSKSDCMSTEYADNSPYRTKCTLYTCASSYYKSTRDGRNTRYSRHSAGRCIYLRNNYILDNMSYCMYTACNRGMRYSTYRSVYNTCYDKYSYSRNTHCNTNIRLCRHSTDCRIHNQCHNSYYHTRSLRCAF